MDGYDVVTVDDHKIGKVVGESGQFLIVEQGALLKSKHPLPREFAHVDDSAQQVRVTVPKEIFSDSPKVDDDFDEQAAAEYYGLAPRPAPERRAMARRTQAIRRARPRSRLPGRGSSRPRKSVRASAKATSSRPSGVVTRLARRPTGRNRRAGAASGAS